MEKTKFNQKQKLFTIIAMVSIALIATTSWTATNNFNFLSGGITDSNPYPSSTSILNDPPYVTPSPTPPSDEDGSLYLTLYMSPNPATQRDTVVGEIFSNFWGVEVVVHYIDGIEYSQSITMTDDVMDIGYGKFTITLKSGSYDFWVTYGSLQSNHVTLVVV